MLRNLSKLAIAGVLILGPISSAYSWDQLTEGEGNEFGGVRTHYNPSFGPFEKFFADDKTQRSQDIVESGFFGLYIVCDTGEKIVRVQYAKWDSSTREWLAVPLAPIKRVNVKFGSEKPISWNVSNSEWWEDGSKTSYLSLIFNNPTLFMKKLNSKGSVSLPIEADRKNYQVKFLTKGFKNYVSSFKKAGCA
jgi:hypothetical protein